MVSERLLSPEPATAFEVPVTFTEPLFAPAVAVLVRVTVIAALFVVLGASALMKPAAVRFADGPENAVLSVSVKPATLTAPLFTVRATGEKLPPSWMDASGTGFGVSEVKIAER